MKKRLLKKSRLLVASSSLFSLAVLPIPSQIHLNTSPRVLLANPSHAAVQSKLIGHTNGKQIIHLTLSLNLRDQNGLNALLQNLYNPSSPEYHHFLKPGQFGQIFGASQSDIDEVVNFAKSSGLQIDSISSEHTFIRVSGPVGKVEKAFGVTINDYQGKNGKVYYANVNAPSIPSSISTKIRGVVGLDNAANWHQQDLANSANPRVGSGPAGGYTPGELRSAYDINPLINSGINGTGQTMALMELDGYDSTNISTYDSNYSLNSPAPTNTFVDGATGSAGNGQTEVELDIEVMQAIAPSANVQVYEGPNTDQGLIDTYQKIATDDTAQSVSTSWGQSELNSNSSTMSSLDTIFQQMATQGQSIFAAAGDDGAYDAGDGQLAVDSPANDPYVTGVGGTNLQLNSGTYGSESVWSNNSTNPPSGGGGGLSTVYNQPSWQTGNGTSNNYSNGMREVPDVSADADPSSGYSIYTKGQWTVVGGTSAAAPLWAAVAALDNQFASANGKSNLGQANPVLYQVFNSTQTYPAFNDVATGDNLYYPATSGYDMASGIGTPDVYNLVRDINGVS